jgi:hypothetical protein
MRNLLLVLPMAHLTEADMRRYVAGTGNVETARHVRVCPCCAQLLADVAQRNVAWERRGVLKRLVRVDPSQVIDELLAEIEQERTRRAA